MTNPSTLFTKFLVGWTKRTGKNANDIAKAAGINRQTAYNYLAGTEPLLDNAANIAHALGVSLGEVIGESDGHDLKECYRRIGEAITSPKLKISMSDQECLEYLKERGLSPGAIEDIRKALAQSRV